MKRILLLSLQMSLMAISQAQDTARVQIRAHALYNPEKRIFYAGIDNPFSLSLRDVNPDSLMVMAAVGELSGSRGEYTFRFTGDSKQMPEATLLYLAVTDTAGDTTFLDSVSFMLDVIPEPEALIAGRAGGKIKKETVLAADSIAVILRNCHLKPVYKVLSFNLTYHRDIWFYEFKQTDGCRFTEQQKSAIFHMGLGSFFYFEQIRVKGPGGLVRLLPVMEFEISL